MGTVNLYSIKLLAVSHQIVILASALLTLLHSEQPKFYGVLAILSAIGLKYSRNFNTGDRWSFGHSECNRVKVQ